MVVVVGFRHMTPAGARVSANLAPDGESLQGSCVSASVRDGCFERTSPDKVNRANFAVGVCEKARPPMLRQRLAQTPAELHEKTICDKLEQTGFQHWGARLVGTTHF